MALQYLYQNTNGDKTMTGTELDSYVYPGPRYTKSGYTNGAGQGITLRDYFAGQALAGLAQDESVTAKRAGEIAYEMANAMLEARKLPEAENLVSNGDFSNGSDGWRTYVRTPEGGE
jgi:hypothetical protein